MNGQGLFGDSALIKCVRSRGLGRTRRRDASAGFWIAGVDHLAEFYALSVVFQKGPGQVEQLSDPGVADVVKRLATRALHFDQSAPAQAGQVAGDAALEGPEFLDKLAHVAFALVEQSQDSQPGGIAEAAEELGRNSIRAWPRYYQRTAEPKSFRQGAGLYGLSYSLPQPSTARRQSSMSRPPKAAGGIQTE